jgi:cytoskeletal protein CcmA (bactofilin family)
MWESKKKDRAVKVTTLIGHGTEVDGSVAFSGGLHVDGVVKGDISADTEHAESSLTVGGKGLVQGDIRVPRVTIDGAVEGNVYSSQLVELSANAKITGNIHYSRIEMAMGAEVNGQLIPAKLTPDEAGGAAAASDS